MSLIVDLGRSLAQLTDPRFRHVLWKSLAISLAGLALMTATAALTGAALVGAAAGACAVRRRAKARTAWPEEEAPARPPAKPG